LKISDVHPSADLRFMTDWKTIAASVNPPIPAAEVDKIVPVLEALEAAFQPLTLTIPQGTDIWNGPE
jgi:hypothetical protein